MYEELKLISGLKERGSSVEKSAWDAGQGKGKEEKTV